MLPIASNPAVSAAVVLSGGATLIALVLSVKAWKKQRNPIDLAYAVATAGWLIYLLTSSASGFSKNHPPVVFFAHAGYQIVIVAVSFFLLISASVTRFEIHAVWMAQGVIGLLLLAWNEWGPLQRDLAYTLWVALNLVCISALSLCVGRNAYRLGGYRNWMVLVGCLLGLGISTLDLLAFDDLPASSLAHYFYAAFLLLLWPLVADRGGRLETGADHPQTTGWNTVTGMGPATDFAAAAVASERRRIAQDLHDGVGSQLVNILATLDTHAPQQQSVALALEQCLVDLKVMVDGIDSTDESVVEALGRLRYRVQHALDKLGIRMVWAVDVDGPLQDFHGERAQQVLRITQECLSNIMCHAKATVVEVVCHYLPESNSLLLEVRDNGCGIASREAGRPAGKGLEGMQRRARKLDGYLQIATKPRVGTRVRLLVPLQTCEAAG